MRAFHYLICGSAVLAMSAVASSDVIAYTNFGPNMAFNTKLGLFLGGPKTEAQGVGFTSLATGKLTKIIVALSGVQVKNGDNFNVNFDNSAGGVPTTSMVGFLGNTPPMTLGDSKPLLTLTPGAFGMVQLTKGTSYFVTITSGVGTSIASWNLASPNVMGSTATMDNTTNKWAGSNNSSQGALQVEVTPEPSSFLALGLGMGVLALFRRKTSNRAQRPA